jgi:GNAT superfamily N-acetyltransferase
MAKVKVRRTNREELPGIAVLRDAVAADLEAFPASSGVLDLDIDIDPNLRHLITHDPDGFFTATKNDETLGFAAAHVRSRQWILSELWVLPQHQGQGAGESLLSRVLAYGERSGAREFLAVTPVETRIQAILLKHGFEALTPVYLFSLPATSAEQLAAQLIGLLPGKEVTADLFNRRGQADLDRIDRLTRNITREGDHVFWLKEQGMRAAFVRQGERVAAYAYGSDTQIGPVSANSQEAALSAVGWAIQFAVKSGDADTIQIRVPAPFTAAIDALSDAGAHLESTYLVYGKGVSLPLDRSVLGPVCLP